MRALLLLVCGVLWCAAGRAESWQDQFQRELPLLGHRNWVMIVDSAYPLQVSPGVRTIETDQDQLAVLQDVLKQLGATRHVRPIVFEDSELRFVPESAAPGVSKYREQLKQVLGQRAVQTLPHEQIISRVDETAKTFRVVILKTTLTIPYTSVFLQMDCKYWGAEDDKRLRAAMRNH